MTNLTEFWNKDHQDRPSDRNETGYAAEKEPLFLRNSEVLDLGGGRGFDALFFAQKGHKVTLADISDYALGVVKEKAERLGLTVDTLELNFAETDSWPLDKRFDVVYSRLALQYFDYPTTVKIFRNINTILKPNGKVFIVIKSPQDETEMKFLRSNAKEISDNVFLEGTDSIKSRFSFEQLKNMLIEAGVKNGVVGNYNENLANRGEVAKSGNKIMVLNEITWTK